MLSFTMLAVMVIRLSPGILAGFYVATILMALRRAWWVFRMDRGLRNVCSVP